jgi:hypothetical protein
MAACGSKRLALRLALHLRLRVHREVVVAEDIDKLAEGVANIVACHLRIRPRPKTCSTPSRQIHGLLS